MAKKVLITRAKEDNKYLREILISKNYQSIEINLI